MPKRLHLVFGGELADSEQSRFRNPDDVEIIGLYPDYDSAYAAWKDVSQRTVDNAMIRYFIAHLHRLLDEQQPGSATREIDSNGP
ncbi:MAG: DUF4170 domain-containing protein [Rhodobacteraceae bacterium]|nr:DUF4170 domain-containing protein [Paracoccaceae bacterium]